MFESFHTQDHNTINAFDGDEVGTLIIFNQLPFYCQCIISGAFRIIGWLTSGTGGNLRLRRDLQGSVKAGYDFLTPNLILLPLQ